MADEIKISVPEFPPGKGVTQKKKEDRSSIRHTEKVISGNAVTKKKSLGSKMAGLIFAEEMQEVKNYIIYETIIPGIKETIIDAIEMMFFPGTTRGRRNSNRTKTSRSYSSIDYGSFSKDTSRKKRETPNKRVEFEDIQFESFADADDVLKSLRADIERYDEATLASYYEAAGFTADWTLFDFGWTNLDMVPRPRRVRGGYYVLDLPKPQSLTVNI